MTDALLDPIEGAEHQEFGRAGVDIMPIGAARMKRIVYPPGLRWSTDMRPLVGTELCQHAHIGFLARGRLEIEYPDGCVVEFRAPQAVVIEPGHDAFIPGDEPAVLIQFDFERDTSARLGIADSHTHA